MRHRVETTLPYAGALSPGVLGHVVATSTPGVELWRDGVYRRALRLPGGPATLALQPLSGVVRAVFRLSDAADEGEAVRRCRRLLDMDAPMATIDEALATDPALRPILTAGQRIPGTVDPAELVIKVLLGQQVSTAAARTLASRLTQAYGEAIDDPDGGLTRLFPTPAAIATADPDTLAMPRRRAQTLVLVARLLAEGAIDLTDLPTVRTQLLSLPGIGPWTVELVAMRGLGDPDAFPASDLGVRKALAQLPGVDPERWRPWRSYATQQLWASLDHEVNRLP